MIHNGVTHMKLIAKSVRVKINVQKSFKRRDFVNYM